MFKFSFQLSLLLLLLPVCLWAKAQERPPLGSLDVSGRVKMGGKQIKLQRKRFYLFRGGLAENKALVERLKTADLASRDCYYSQIKTSPQFICWLKTNDCESPYCREMAAEDIGRVPEFQAAYQKGLRQFRRPELARHWLTTNLSPDLLTGFYRQQKSLLAGLFGELEPLQSSMTDTTSIKALFIDISLNLSQAKKSETFLVSNLLPVEIGDKSYIWACQVDIGTAKRAVLQLAVPENNNPIKNCEVIVKELKTCSAEGCPQ